MELCKIIRPGRCRLVAVALLLIASPTLSAEESGNTSPLQAHLGEVFQRSMAHWGYDYRGLPGHKAGVACVPWAGLTEAFLENEIFGALGFSYSMADDAGALNVATQGCQIMKRRKKMSGCECATVLLGEEVVVAVPDVTGE